MKRFYPLMGSIGVLFLFISTSILVSKKFLIYNYTDSLPHGIYLLHSGAIKKGDLIVFEPPLAVRKIIHERKYLRDDGYLMKYMVGEPGDSVCTDNDTFSVAGTIFGKTLLTDTTGKPLPRYSFSGRLKEGYLVAIKGKNNSFDSRYFGPIQTSTIIGIAKPLWIEEDSKICQ